MSWCISILCLNVFVFVFVILVISVFTLYYIFSLFSAVFILCISPASRQKGLTVYTNDW